MNNLLSELITRIKENCAGSSHTLTQEQLEDIQDSLQHFASRFEQMESICEMADAYRSQLSAELQKALSDMFDI